MKKVIIFLLVLLLAFVPVLSFADVDLIGLIPNDGNTYKVITYNKISVGGSYEYSYKLYTSNTPFVVEDDISTGNKKLVYSGNANFYRCTLGEDDEWKFIYSSYDSWEYCYSTKPASTIETIYSTHNIQHVDGSVFFSVPRVSPLLSSAKQIRMNHLLGLILAGLIPLLGLLILGISLRKGWGFLRNQLMH